ncbi:MAG: helix-turn-helix transcriptional regulator [Bifidobacteriaceae bacterium]|jgi:DNA-binding CsgD family transcriptional regulator|nr:helix-turn-helix transcriptional regulator [Bifidobacteriaceae bacterium]
MAGDDARGQDTSFGYLVSILGFGLCRAWIVFSLSIPLVRPRFADSWAFLVAGALAALAVPPFARRFQRGTRYLRLKLFRVTAVFLLAGSLLLPCALWLGSWGALLFSWTVGGVGAGLLQVLWGERFATNPPRFSLTVAPAAAILTAVVVALSNSETTLLALFILPVISFVLLVLEVDGARFGQQLLRRRPALACPETANHDEQHPTDTTDTGVERPDDSGRDGVARDPRAPRVLDRGFDSAVWKLMFSILVFSFICRSFDALPLADAGPFALFGGSVLFALIVVGVTFLILAAALKERFNVTLTYRLSLPLMMMGFAVLALFIDSHAATSLLLINMGYEFFDILSWILFADVARREGDRQFRVFSLGVAFTFIGMALGNLFGETLVHFLMDDVTQATSMVLLCMVALVLVAFLVIPEGTVLALAGSLFAERGHGAAEAEGEGNAGAPDGIGGKTGTSAGGPTAQSLGSPSLDHACGQVASQYRLTAREAEVLALLARGRTLVIIARELTIANGTARTHIERVYAKLGVHKQQELIDLIESSSPENNNHERT